MLELPSVTLCSVEPHKIDGGGKLKPTRSLFDNNNNRNVCKPIHSPDIIKVTTHVFTIQQKRARHR